MCRHPPHGAGSAWTVHISVAAVPIRRAQMDSAVQAASDDASGIRFLLLATRSSPRVGLGTFDKAVTFRAAEESIDRIGETEKGRPYSIRGRPKLASGAFCLPANGALSPMPAWRKAPRVGKGRYSSLATSRTYTLPPLEQNGPDASIGMSRPWADHECGDRLDL